MKQLIFLLIPLLSLIACDSSETATPMGEIEIKANIGPLCPTANVSDKTPCGYSIEKLNEIYSNYTLKILAEKNGSETEVYSTKLSYSDKVTKALPLGKYNISVNHQTVAATTNLQTFTVSSAEKQILELNIDTGIR